MGLILPQTVRIRTNGKTCKHYREKGYEFKKCGDFIEVDVLDLYPGSKEMVKVICDICGKESEMWYRTVVKCNKENKLITCASNSCINKKREYTCMKKYGVKNVNQSEEIKNRTKETNLERYGCICSLQSEEIKKKAKKTWQEKYGENITSPMQVESIKNKVKETNLKRYGHECTFGSKEIQNKAKKTWQEKYGENIINPFQVESIKEKSKQTLLKNYGVYYPVKSSIIQDRIKAINLERYGSESPFGSKEIQNKSKKTWQEKYGEDITSPFQVESIKEKSKQTLLKNYNVDNPAKSSIIQDRIRATNLERYGSENPFGSKEIQNKAKKTWQEKYGENITNPGQVEDIKNKILSSFQFNHTGPSSRAQRYINHILNGTLNKHICGSLVDIYMEKENIIIEYDGSGHFLGDKMNGNIYPTKESLLYEKEREDKIINNGYRMIRFIATKDRIPSDEVILNLVEGFKNSDFKVVRIDFEKGTIEKDYEEKSYRNFGKLRKITKEDLEQFEKQGENTSKN